MSYREGDVAIHAFWMPHREEPALDRAPVVRDEPHLANLKRIEHADEIVDQPIKFVIGNPRWNRALATAAGVHRDDAVARRDQRRNLLAPDRVIVRKAVDE